MTADFSTLDFDAYHRGERGYDDVLLGREDGQVEHVAERS